ncbi:MAG: acyl carrier protein [Caldisericia bacterium]|jgi:acyl carrier protein|nr:acyl carrier protein [Caldisericia bacterium]MDD3427477.1 acyl carrier protein [Caldisericia bacterium]MDD5689493.1 acyl carrier protein [Caldisericia bacterium]HOJ15852.1 acyl carrier protein [Caldisericia bacterium]HOW02429.1 acyl carrier protein [Caldisericia bacterium]
MTEKEIFEKVKPIIADKLGIDQDQIKMESNFINDLGADSLGLVDITMALEEEFGTEIPDEEASKLTTVGAMVDFIKNNYKG